MSVSKFRLVIVFSALFADLTHPNILRAQSALQVAITSPLNGATTLTPNPLRITGTVSGAGLAAYDLQTGVGSAPVQWFNLIHGTAPITDDLIGQVELGDLPPGLIALRLVATTASGTIYTAQITITNKGNQIDQPRPPTVPNEAQWLQSGTSITIVGGAYSSTAQRYELDWAPGINPTAGWSTAGVTRRATGRESGAFNTLGSWASPADARGYFTIRSRLFCSNWTFESTTLVLLEPTLAPGWPRTSLRNFAPAQVMTGQVNGVTQLLLGGGSNVNRFSLAGQPLYAAALGGYAMRPAAGHVAGVVGDVFVVAEVTNQLRLIRPDNSFVSMRTANGQTLGASPVQLTDLSGDGQAEILVMTEDSTSTFLYAFNPDGSLFSPKYPIVLRKKAADGNRGARFVAFDASRAGHAQLWVVEPATGAALVRRFDADGTPLNTVVTLPNEDITALAAADLLNTKTPQLLLTTRETTSTQTHVRVFDADGSPRGNWPVTLNQPITGLAVGDLAGDGLLSVVVSGSQSIAAYNRFGTLQPGWPVVVPDGAVETVIADLDGDGAGDVLFGTQGLLPNPLSSTGGTYVETRLIALHGDGRPFREWKLPGHFQPAFPGSAISLAVGDFNNTGTVSIAVAYVIGVDTGFSYLTSTQLALLNLTSAASTQPSWPYPLSDPQNTNLMHLPLLAPPSTTCDPVERHQFLGCYYDDDAAAPGSFSKLAYRQVDPAIAYDWGLGAPSPRLPSDRFSIRWRGDFPFRSGAWDFHVTADDGVRLRIDGALVIDQWTDHPATAYSATVRLSPGLHRIELEYYENGGSASIQVSWNANAAPF